MQGSLFVSKLVNIWTNFLFRRIGLNDKTGRLVSYITELIAL